MASCAVQCVMAVVALGLMVSCLANLHGADIPEGTCVCSTQDTALNRRPGFVHPAVMYLLHDKCVLTHGNKTDIWGEAWYTVDVDDDVLWGTGANLAQVKDSFCGLP